MQSYDLYAFGVKKNDGTYSGKFSPAAHTEQPHLQQE